MDLTDKNLFAYCDNNPVMRSDEGGYFWGVNLLVGAVVGGGFSLGWQMIVEHKSLSEVNWYDVGASAISGLVAASGLGLGWQLGINGVLGGATSAASGGDGWDIAVSTGLGVLSGAIGGKGANYKGELKSAVQQSKTRIKGVATTIKQKAAKKAATQARKQGKQQVKKIVSSATTRFAAGYSAAKVGYYYYNYERRGSAY